MALRSSFQSPGMTITTKNTAEVINTSIYHKKSCSEQEIKIQVLEQQPSTIQTQFCATHVYAIHRKP